MAISIGNSSSSTGSRGSGISSRLDFSNVMSLAKDFRDIYEKERTELQEQRSLIEGLKEAVRNEDPNSYAYQTFMNFYNNYDKDISEFAAHGLTPDLLRNLNWDRDQYVKGVSKIGAAINARNALLKAADTLTQTNPDKQYLIQNDPRDLTLDDLIANPDIGLGQVIDLNALRAQVSAAGAIIRDQGLITGYNDENKTYDRKMITTDQVNNFLLDFTGKNMDSNDDIWNKYGESDQEAEDQTRVNDILGGVVGRIWDANFGNVNWITPEQENQAKNVMVSALHQAISPSGGYVQPKSSSSGGSTDPRKYMDKVDPNNYQHSPSSWKASEAFKAVTNNRTDGFKVSINPIKDNEGHVYYGSYNISFDAKNLLFDGNKNSSNGKFVTYTIDDGLKFDDPMNVHVFTVSDKKDSEGNITGANVVYWAGSNKFTSDTIKEFATKRIYSGIAIDYDVYGKIEDGYYNYKERAISDRYGNDCVIVYTNNEKTKGVAFSPWALNQTRVKNNNTKGNNSTDGSGDLGGGDGNIGQLPSN